MVVIEIAFGGVGVTAVYGGLVALGEPPQADAASRRTVRTATECAGRSAHFWTC